MIYTSPYTRRPRRTNEAAEKDLKFKLHVVSHTHWDREWYSSFQQFRMHLVLLIDRLIELLERVPEYRYFVLDGQTVILEDYLEVRPEKKERLRNLVQAGRLEIGPWYVQPDEFLVSGESLVRNLLHGHRMAASYGGVMNVCYTPDSFGHIAQLPQIIRGFNLDSFIFTRGMGDEQDQLKTEFLWSSPDGNRVLAVNQIKNYCNGANLGAEAPFDENSTTQRFDVLLDFIAQEAADIGSHAKPGTDGVRHVLINNGCDHREPQPDLPRMLVYANAVLSEIQLEHTTFSRYIQTIRRASLSLPDHTGVLRSGKRHFILPGIWSSRVYLKQQNDECELLLSKVAEPLSVLFWQCFGSESFSSFLQQAWKSLLKNHAHDSIGGCSIDQVHHDMLPRFEEARQLGRIVASSALDFLAMQVESKDAPTVLVVNPAPYKRSTVLRSLMLVPPGRPINRLSLVDSQGQTIPTNVIRSHNLVPRPNYALPSALLRKAPLDGSGVRPLDFEAKLQLAKHEMEAYGLNVTKGEKPWKLLEVEYLATGVPALGYRSYSLQATETVTPDFPVQVKLRTNTVENKFFQVTFRSNGTIDMYHKATKRKYQNIGLFEDGGDIGDEYDYGPPKRDSLISNRTHRGKIKIVHKSPLLVEVIVSGTLALPVAFDNKRQRRSQKTVKCDYSWKFTVTAASPWLAAELTVNNQARDHRLRLLLPTPLKSQKTLAGQGYYVMESPVRVPKVKNWRQPPQPAMPMREFCAIEDRRGGLAVLTHGLYEYEAVKAKGGNALALTLLRSVGWLSRDDLQTRPGHAGPAYLTPEAQCLGTLNFKLAFFPYAGKAERVNLTKIADEYRTPVFEEFCTNESGSQTPDLSLISLEPENLVVTAIKKSDSRNTIIVRMFNASSERVKGVLVWNVPVSHAWRVNLAEERQEEITVYSRSRIELDFPAWRINTIELEAGRRIAGGATPKAF